MFSLSEGPTLTLSGADLQALHDAQQWLLTPSVEDENEGLRQCSTALTDLLGTPHTAACLRRNGTWHVGSGAMRFEEQVHAALAVAPTGNPVFTTAGFPHLLSVQVQTPHGQGLICAAFETSTAPLFGLAGQTRLALLVPALRSRIERQLPESTPLLDAIERLGEPLALYDAEGTALCHSGAFRRLLREEPQAQRIHAEAQQLARLLCLPPVTGSETLRESVAQTRMMSTRRSRYELHGSRFPRQLLPHPAALIHLRASRNRMPSKVRLRQRLGLTAREVEIALLVAEGLTSKEIAVRLCLSTNTVRRHGEKVLEKLGLHTRAGVALALMREG